MDELFILIALLVTISIIFYLLTYLKYKAAMLNSKNHVERTSIFRDLMHLTFEYERAREEGLFSDAPITEEYLSKMDNLFDNGLGNMALVRFKVNMTNYQLLYELLQANRNVTNFMDRYSSILLRLYKANQPIRFKLTSLKKIALVRILFCLVSALDIVSKALKESDRLLKAVKKILNIPVASNLYDWVSRLWAIPHDENQLFEEFRIHQ